MRQELRSRLETGGPLVADGATGTQLQARGLQSGEASEAWNLSRPDDVAAVAADYAAAGCDLVYTNSFGGNPWRLERHQLVDRLDEINRSAAQLARQGAGDEVYVIGSMGPTGEFLAPLGTLQPDDVSAAYQRQATALIAGGADGLVCETFAAIEEIAAAVRGARAATDKPIIASLTYGAGGRTMMGVAPAEAIGELVEAGADVVGLNCGDDLSIVPEVLAAYRNASPGTPILIKPNAGMPAIVGGQPVWPVGPEAFAGLAQEWLAAGATIVGGCCGTSPDHLRAVAAAVRG